MARRINFFASRTDIEKIIWNIENSIQLNYFVVKNYDNQNIQMYESLKEFENLGINKSGDRLRERFLVMESNDQLELETVPLLSGETIYTINQEKNKKSALFWPGGMYDGEFLIAGCVSTVYSEELKLFNVFQRNIKKQCKTKIGIFYIGEDAMTLYEQYRFITIDIRESKEYDLNMSIQQYLQSENQHN